MNEYEKNQIIEAIEILLKTLKSEYTIHPPIVPPMGPEPKPMGNR